MDWGTIPSDHARIASAASITALGVVLQHFWRRSRAFASADPARRHHLLKAGAGVILALGAVAGAWRHGGDRSLLPFGLGMPSVALPLLGGAALVIFTVTFLASRRPGFAKEYPEAPLGTFTWPSWGENAAAWAIYLLGYELMFRGFCLHAFVDLMGLVPGVAIMTALYVLAHLPKSLTESLGSFPMGVFFAALTLEGQSVLYPWLLHVGMAVFADTMGQRARRVGV